MKPLLQRRNFLLLGAAATSFPAFSQFANSDPNGRLAAAVARLFRNSRDAEAVGAAFLSDQPHERDDLLDRIFGVDLEIMRKAVELAEIGTLECFVASRIEDDLKAARIYVQRGWVIARSEAHLCAVAALA